MSVVWINGAFGVGKTTVAAELVSLLPSARIVDPERIGFVMRRTFWRDVDYQDVELWRSLTARRVRSAGRRGTAIVPMTVTDVDVFDRLTVGAQTFLLTAERRTLERRIARSAEASGWRSSQLDRCLHAFEVADLGTPVPADDRSPAEIASAIAGLVVTPSR